MSTEHTCVRCDRPMRHDTAEICGPAVETRHQEDEMSTDPLEAMRRNLSLAGVNGPVINGSAALDLAAKLAACSIAEDVRAIRELLESQRHEHHWVPNETPNETLSGIRRDRCACGEERVP